MKTIPSAKLLAVVSQDKAYAGRYKKIKSLISDLGIQEIIKIIPPVSYKELPNYVKSSDCVVIPSLAEGFGFCAAAGAKLGRSDARTGS